MRVTHFFVHFLAWLFVFWHCICIHLFVLFFPIVLCIIFLFFLPSFSHLHCLIVLQVLAVLFPRCKRPSIANIWLFLCSGLEIVVLVGGAIGFVVFPLFFCVFFSFHVFTVCADYFVGFAGLDSSILGVNRHRHSVLLRSGLANCCGGGWRNYFCGVAVFFCVFAPSFHPFIFPSFFGCWYHCKTRPAWELRPPLPCFLASPYFAIPPHQSQTIPNTYACIFVPLRLIPKKSCPGKFPRP